LKSWQCQASGCGRLIDGGCASTRRLLVSHIFNRPGSHFAGQLLTDTSFSGLTGITFLLSVLLSTPFSIVSCAARKPQQRWHVRVALAREALVLSSRLSFALAMLQYSEQTHDHFCDAVI